jgi:Flp pilus assembly pilin Flp
MKTFLIACLAAGVIAIGSVAVLNGIQKPVDSAFTTTGVRI